MNKIPEFYMIFARKMPEFFIIIARKIFSPNFRGHVLPCPHLLRLCPHSRTIGIASCVAVAL